MVLTVEKGRPEKSEGRSKKELAVYDYLDKLGKRIPWKIAPGLKRHFQQEYAKISFLRTVSTAFTIFL